MKKIFIISAIVAVSALLCAFGIMPQGISVEEDNGIYVIKLPKNVLLEPYVAEGVKTNKEVFKNNNFILSMNAGYFDTVNKQTTSYVVIDGETVLDPTDNKNLINNPKLQAGMDKILNRSELRYLACPLENKYVIQKHFEPVEDGCTILSSIQAGPQLLPKLNMEEEFFIAKEKGEIIRDAIGMNRIVPRIAVGISDDNSLYIFVATKKHPMSMPQFAQYISNRGINNAINFDGGGSVSLNYKDLDIFSEHKNTRRQVKSFLVVKKY